MHINTSINKSKKPKGRPKKVKVVESSFALGGELADKSFSSHSSKGEIEVKTSIETSKNENQNHLFY